MVGVENVDKHPLENRAFNIFYRRSVTRSYRRIRAANNSAVGRVVRPIIRPRRNNQRRFNRRCYNECTFTRQVTRRVS